MLFLDAIERIEIGVRVSVALMLGARDPWAHRNPSNLHGNFTKKAGKKPGRISHRDWLAKLDKATKRSREKFVSHFKRKYSSELPIWMAIELWDFGLLSIFLSGMTFEDQQALARNYGIPRGELLASWMRSINHVRNICAHHCRLWNRSPADQPKPPKAGEIPLLDHLAGDRHAQVRLYAVAAVMQFLLRTINPTTSWGSRLKRHMAGFPAGAPGIAVGDTGFPQGWESLPLWE